MSKYDLVIFDLDGTLLDTGEGILEAVKHTVSVLGLEPLTDEEIKESFIGPPIQNSFMKRYGIEQERIQDVAKIFRDYYSTESLLLARLYDGMERLFDSLGELSVKAAVATYKREDYALRLLRHFGFGRYTDIMHGADDKNVLKKSDIIELCIRESGVSDRSRIVMVGDTDGDRLGAERAGVDFIGVTYGFGYKTRADVMSGYAVGAAETPIEILELIK